MNPGDRAAEARTGGVDVGGRAGAGFLRPAIGDVVQQHQVMAAHLHGARARLLDAPHARLHQLARLDERLLAHLDGLTVAGAAGRQTTTAALASPWPGEVFCATVRALEDGDAPALDRLLALVAALPGVRGGLVAAFGWVSAGVLKGVTCGLLDSADPARQAIGLEACASHGADPGTALDAALRSPDDALRACALEVSGRLARLDTLPACRQALADPNPRCRLAAARAATWLGDRDAAPAVLRDLAHQPGPERPAALSTWLKVAPAADARSTLQALGAEPGHHRLLLQGVGLAGDIDAMPWLLQQMTEPASARLAGEAWQALTGADLAALGLDGPALPKGAVDADASADGGPLPLEEDDDLPWPDPSAVADWWARHAECFLPGTRHFHGTPRSPAGALGVLAIGTQRQRRHAAEHLTLLQPGTPLFDTAAPAWRQRRRLLALGAAPSDEP